MFDRMRWQLLHAAAPSNGPGRGVDSDALAFVMQAQTKTENWCGVLQEVALPGTQGDPDAFLEAAVKFANEECWGTLSCSLMVRPGLLLLRHLFARHCEPPLSC